MGIADFARHYPTSFKRKCTLGETTYLTLRRSQKGIEAVNPVGHLLFTLVQDDDEGFLMLGADNSTALTSSPGAIKGGYVIKDRQGVHLASLDKGTVSIDGATYAWKKKLGVFGGDTIFVLKQSTEGTGGAVLAEVILTAKIKGRADVTAYPAAVNIPLGLIIFQGLIFHYRWLNLSPLKKVAFSSFWM